MRMAMTLGLGLATSVLVAAIGRAQVAAPDPPGSPRKAVERALPLLQESARIWTRERGCFSCHHQGLGITAVALARERGFAVDEAMFAAQVAETRQELAPPEVSAALPPNADMLDDSLMLVALGAVGAAPEAATDREIYRLLGGQHVSGHWTPYPFRMPLEGSLFQQTAWAIRALRLYAPPAHNRDVDAHVRRGVDWLAQEPPVETQDVAMQLLGFAWSGVASDRIAKAATQLLALQRADGGWGQIVSRPSDAYATGQALVALNQAGRLSPDTAAFKKGLAFLMASQKPDGSWLVETRRTWKRGLQYFESGFPHGKHQFISYAGSAWAAMALMLAERHERSAVIMGNPRTSSARQSAPPSTGSAAADDGLTPLMRSALLGSLEEFRAALKQDQNVNAVATELGVTALMCAAHDARKVAMLIEAAADVKAATTSGYTALHVAAAYDGAAESVRLLLKHGADPNARARSNFGTALARATLRGDRAVAALLIDAGATVNNRPEGSVPLMAATLQGDLEFVTFLLDRQATVDSSPVAMAPVGNGEQQPTALMAAAERSAPDLVALLLKRGANVNATDRRGMTALMYAAGAIDIGPQTKAVVDLLLAAKADVSARTPAGDTALDFAVRYRNAAVEARLRDASGTAERSGGRAPR
jgi:ankyrin repeat protein